MPNVFLESDMVTATALDHFENNLVLARLVDRQWESKFGIEGAKIGDTCRLRRHNNPTVSTGNAFAPQNIEEASRTLRIDTPLHVDYIVDDADFALTWDRAEDRYWKPAGRSLANKVDLEIAKLYKKVSNFVGTYNTAPTALTDFNSCRARLSQFGVPEEDRHFVLDPVTGNAAVVAMQALFNNQQKIGTQYTTGKMGKNVLGADWDESQNIAAHTSGADADETDITVLTAPASGATSIALTGYTASTTAAVREGDIFTIAAINAVNPITGEDLGILRQFVITSDQDSNASGEITAPIDPPMTSSGPRKTVTALPAVGAALTHVTLGASVVANQPMYFHKHWAALAIAAQVVPRGLHAAGMKSDPDNGGIGIRYTHWWDGNTNQWKIRFDILIGLLAQLPEFCLRIGTS